MSFALAGNFFHTTTRTLTTHKKINTNESLCLKT